MRILFSRFYYERAGNDAGICRKSREIRQSIGCCSGVEEIKEYLAGNLCRCTGYMGQLRAIQNYMADRKMTEENVPEKKEVQA